MLSAEASVSRLGLALGSGTQACALCLSSWLGSGAEARCLNGLPDIRVGLGAELRSLGRPSGNLDPSL